MRRVFDFREISAAAAERLVGLDMRKRHVNNRKMEHVVAVLEGRNEPKWALGRANVQ
jgi:hypothetical protein